MTSLVSSLKRKLSSLLPLGAAPDADTVEPEVGTPPTAGDFGDPERPCKRPRLRSDADDVEGPTSPHPPQPESRSAAPLLVREPSPAAGGEASAGARAIASGSGGDDAADNDNGSDQPSALLRLLPRDALSHCLSYLSTPSDRFGLQVACAAFREVSDRDVMLAGLELGGGALSSYAPYDDDGDVGGGAGGGDGDGNVDDDGTGTEEGDAGGGEADQERPSQPAGGGIILDGDTSVSACEKLAKFAAAGNAQAIYMIAMILCYCHENVSEGLALLRHAAKSSTHLPSIYALALILRDSHPIEADYYLNVAASLGHAPAWQEKLTAAEMRARFGDLDAGDLAQFLDPPCLNRLLGRHYLECRRARRFQTSHCWNPLCGRWAYKALRAEGGHLRGAQPELGGARALIARFNARLEELAVASANGNGGGARFRDVFEPVNANDIEGGARTFGVAQCQPCQERPGFSFESLLRKMPTDQMPDAADLSSDTPSPLEQLRRALRDKPRWGGHGLKVSRMKMCSSCRRAKYCSKLCQVYDWRSGRHKMECQFL